MRDMRWLADREDPRTFLAACVGVLGLIGVFAKPMMDRGVPELWVLPILAVALIQVVWAVLRYRRWRADRDKDGF